MSPRNFSPRLEAHYFHLCVRLQESVINLSDLEQGMQSCLEELRSLTPELSSYHSFVFMGDHFHALIDLNGEFPFYYPNNISILWKPLFSYASYLETYRYIYRNPIEEKLIVEPERYPYSSLSWLLGKRSNPGLDVIDRLKVIQNPLKVLRWVKGGHSPFHIPQERYLW